MNIAKVPSTSKSLINTLFVPESQSTGYVYVTGMNYGGVSPDKLFVFQMQYGNFAISQGSYFFPSSSNTKEVMIGSTFVLNEVLLGCVTRASFTTTV